jgi:D-glycero-alpha-D-manno-heptose-7-phosphate kinase
VADQDRTEASSYHVGVPTRVDFAGGFTDVPYFSERRGGEVLNFTIDQFVNVWGEMAAGKFTFGYEASRIGGGLGASAAAEVGILATRLALSGLWASPAELAERAFHSERLLGVVGGKQDHYAAALGGCHYLEFAGEFEPGSVSPVTVAQELVTDLERRLVLCELGNRRRSGVLHESVWRNYLSGERKVGDALERAKESVLPARDALVAGDWATLGAMMSLNREAARDFAAELVTPEMDLLFRAATNCDALGSKACGAGGGGTLMILSEPGRRADLEDALRANGASIVPFRFVLNPTFEQKEGYAPDSTSTRADSV